MEYNARTAWTKKFLSEDLAYPAEYVIRIFKGTYPKLNFDKGSYRGKKILDVGCGDGRNMAFLSRLGFKVSGTEITEEITKKVTKNLRNIAKNVDVRVGTNDNLPYKNNYFDFLLSWNSVYYMGDQKNFSAYVSEYNRVLKPNGYLVMSIPKKTCFIYKRSRTVNRGYREIRKDPFGVRNGEIMRIFNNEREIKNEFSAYFKDFIFGSVEDDCFGLSYNWHLVICQKR